MTQTAVVIRIHGPGLAEVRVRRSSACSADCSSCGGCETPDVDVLAINSEGAGIGDRVLIEGSRTVLLAALVYLLPIVLFFIGWVFHPVAGAVGVLTGVGVVMVVNRFLQNKGGVSARIIAVIPQANEPDNGGF